jgi:glycosyltransferase involved in cell wall biosynthesis
LTFGSRDCRGAQSICTLDRVYEQIEELRSRFPRVAVVHEWLTIPGGSEQVVLQLLEMFPEAELFASVYDPTPWPAQITDRKVHASFLNRIPGAERHYTRLLPLMDRAYRSFDLSSFDLVLSSNHASAKNVRTPQRALHVCYCHTPMRYAWDPSFFAEEQVSTPVRLMLPALLRQLRRADLRGAAGPDLFVANSKHVAARIQEHYGRAATVVHPPVDVEPLLESQRSPQDFYLIFGRVVPYKRVDLAVSACRTLGRQLKVAGTGRAMESVSTQAGGASNVEFLGRISDSERGALFSQARALLFPGEEDFGIVPVEAQAAGLPVIAYGVGGATESVVDGRTGVFFAEQTTDSLCAAIERFEGLRLDADQARQNARQFSEERFRQRMAQAIADAAAAKGL